MKLSEEIRLGAMLRPQAFGHLIADGATCAIGAACEAIGQLCCGFPVQWEWAHSQAPVTCLACAKPIWSVALTIVHLNNDHRWTRERIADWLETVEAAQACEQAASVAAVARVDHDQRVLTPRV